MKSDEAFTESLSAMRESEARQPFNLTARARMGLPAGEASANVAKAHWSAGVKSTVRLWGIKHATKRRLTEWNQYNGAVESIKSDKEFCGPH
jgi:hypothetical protein